MQVVVPMSGFGERFRRSGYLIPKPLIQVEGKPIIQHVVELFPGVEDFTFICNAEHLENASFGMEQTLRLIAPHCNIVSIEPHKLGPVHAVLQSLGDLKMEDEVIVNYADFTCLWNFQEFLQRTRSLLADGAVPAYKGFHPHSGGSTNYAYIREAEGRVLGIREKQPFTAFKVDEFASTGTYYFKEAQIMKHFMQEQIARDVSVNGEYYVSSCMDLMAKAGCTVTVHEVHHFMQWGTPEDLEEYSFWSEIFRTLSRVGRDSLPIPGIRNPILLAGGRGERFKSKGYQREKPLLEVSGANLLQQVSKISSEAVTVLTVKGTQVASWLRNNSSAFECVIIPKTSLGQAASAKSALDLEKNQIDQSFTLLPSDSLFASKTSLLSNVPVGRETLTVWVAKPNPIAISNPTSFSWIQKTPHGIEYALKEKPKFKNPLVMIGAFSLSSKKVFTLLYEELMRNKKLINGEVYLDSLVEFTNIANIRVELYKPDFCVSLGTPVEFETFRYWQLCFDQWDSHPYALEDDPFVETPNVAQIRKALKDSRHSPTEWNID